jgi:hypothetical protein
MPVKLSLLITFDPVTPAAVVRPELDDVETGMRHR